MKILFLIPTRCGGEGFDKLIESIKKNINYINEQGWKLIFDVQFIINGNSDKPLKYLSSNAKLGNFVQIKIVDFLGKARSISYCLKEAKHDFVVICDDDIFFGENLIFNAINDLNRINDSRLIAFQNQVLPYSGRNIINNFFYDVINIRSLKKIYKEVDPFLFGRLMVAKRGVINLPDDIINEDLYLSILYSNHYIIRPEKVYYRGEHSILSHFKRVLRIQSGRKQVEKIFSLENNATEIRKRVVDDIVLKNLSFYYLVCYYCYIALRFITVHIICIIFKHNDYYW